MKPTLEAIRELVKEHIGLADLPDPKATIISLGADELDHLEIIMACEEDFEVEILDGNVPDDYTCEELLATLVKQVELAAA